MPDRIRRDSSGPQYSLCPDYATMSEELRAGTPESQNSTCSSYVTAPESPQVSHEMHSPGYTMPVNPMSSDRRLYGYGQHQYILIAMASINGPRVSTL